MKTLHIRSHNKVELIDITRDVCNVIRLHDVSAGQAVIFTPHTTAAISINENADPDVCRDIVVAINKLVPMQDDYLHSEGNSAAHIKSSLFGSSETLIVDNSEVVLGTWQGIYFCEFDGPRQRQVHIQVIAK